MTISTIEPTSTLDYTERFEQFKTDVSNYVRQAAKLLDEDRPTWFQSVDVSNLDMASFDICVLGQVYGHYGTGINRLFPGSRDYNILVHAFSAIVPNSMWANEINRRLYDMTNVPVRNSNVNLERVPA